MSKAERPKGAAPFLIGRFLTSGHQRGFFMGKSSLDEALKAVRNIPPEPEDEPYAPTRMGALLLGAASGFVVGVLIGLIF